MPEVRIYFLYLGTSFGAESANIFKLKVEKISNFTLHSLISPVRYKYLL